MYWPEFDQWEGVEYGLVEFRWDWELWGVQQVGRDKEVELGLVEVPPMELM